MYRYIKYFLFSIMNEFSIGITGNRTRFLQSLAERCLGWECNIYSVHKKSFLTLRAPLICVEQTYVAWKIARFLTEKIAQNSNYRFSFHSIKATFGFVAHFYWVNTHWENFFWKSNTKKTWSHFVYYPYLPFARFLWFFTLKMIYMFSKIFHIFKVCPNNVYISFKTCFTFTNWYE